MRAFLARMLLRGSSAGDAGARAVEGAASIRALGHREYVGGKWEEIGRLQFDFLRAEGLRPEHRLVDVACGALRGGVHFIPYLAPGHYLGLDKEARLIELGLERELGAALRAEKRPEFVVSDDFEFSRFSQRADFGLAQSLFTHLEEGDILRCLGRLRAWVGPGHVFFATFFEGDSAGNPARSHSHAHFRYPRARMEALGRETGWRPRYVGEWGHPRDQRMMCFEAV